ncbi:MAG: hypothetical protein MJK08_04500 [Campylobacterales bacterium]|nr:hypothetical protein [Campylobacterales bacterium]
MVEKRYEISNEDNYKKYNNFVISKNLEKLLRKDYYLYSSKEFNLNEKIENLYKKNFNDKYDLASNSLVYEKYINNESFKNKALFIYSMIDENKYEEFVKNNAKLKNPNDFTLEYSIIDSEGTKINVYNLNIKDISFVY